MPKTLTNHQNLASATKAVGVASVVDVIVVDAALVQMTAIQRQALMPS
jgi:hypothetical protein